MNNMHPQSMQEVLSSQGKLFKKILKVLAGVEKIEKSGYNQHQKYHYSTEQDLIGAVKKLLIDNNLIILTDSETKEVIKLNKYDKGQISGENLVTVVNTRHTFCDTETGYTFSVQSTGTGFDNTDKGAFKAVTGAMKYFISKNFMVATEDDPENDGVTAPKPSAAKTGFSRTATTAAKPVETKVEEVKPEIKIVSDGAVPKEAGTVVNTPNIQTIAKPSFGRRVQTKTEPNFP